MLDQQVRGQQAQVEAQALCYVCLYIYLLYIPKDTFALDEVANESQRAKSMRMSIKAIGMAKRQKPKTGSQRRAQKR